MGKIIWEEVKHVMKFTFMWTKPRGDLSPYQNSRASAFNIQWAEQKLFCTLAKKVKNHVR